MRPMCVVCARAWLEDLAKRRRWETYLEHFRADAEANVTLRCHALAARAALERLDGLEQDIAAQWLAPQSVPDACNPAFDWLRARGVLTAALIEERARLALAAGNPQLARYLSRFLSERTAAPLLQWAALIEHPERAIDELIEHGDREVEPAALLAGWTVLARRDAEGAASRYADFTEARGSE